MTVGQELISDNFIVSDEMLFEQVSVPRSFRMFFLSSHRELDH